MKSLKTAIAILGVLALSACVTGTRKIELSVPESVSTNDKSGEVYIDTISDNRVFEAKPSDPSTPSVNGDLNSLSKDQLAQLIGRQRNGYGKAMGDVSLPDGQSVVDETRDLLAKGLQSRGYTVSNNSNAPIKIDAAIDKFWGWFSPGFWSVSFETRISTNLEVKTKDGVKTVLVEGYGRNNGQVASDANWQLAFSRGFTDFLSKLDQALSEMGL